MVDDHWRRNSYILFFSHFFALYCYFFYNTKSNISLFLSLSLALFLSRPRHLSLSIFLHSLSNLLERGQLVLHTNNIHISNTPKIWTLGVHTLHMVPKCVCYLCDVIIFLLTILLMYHEMYNLVLTSSSDQGMNVKARTKNKGTQARPTIQTR